MGNSSKMKFETIFDELLPEVAAITSLSNLFTASEVAEVVTIV